jgi:uncharacterized protein YukE
VTDHALPTIGFDPAPGDVGEIRAVARLLADAAGEVTSVYRGVVSAGAGAWIGQAATAFHDHLQHDFAPKLKTVSQAFDQASSTVSHWAEAVEGFQLRAVELERRAARAADEAEQAARWLAQHPEIVVAPITDAAAQAEAEARHHARLAWERSRDDALDLVRRLQDEARHLHDEVRSRGRQLAALLHEAQELAPAAPGLFSRMAHAVTDGISSAWAWTKAHAETIKLIGDILSTISAVLGTIAIFTAPFEPIGAIFGAAALGTGALAMGAHALAMAAGADVSWATIGMDAFGMIPGVKGAATGVKVAGRAEGLATAAKLGKGFHVVEQSGKTFKVFGKMKTTFSVVGDGSLASRGKQVFTVLDHNLQQGQMLGTKGLGIVAGKLPGHLGDVLKISPMGVGGRLLDGGLKIVPKTYTVPVTIHNDLHRDHPLKVTHPGDVFHALLAS